MLREIKLPLLKTLFFCLLSAISLILSFPNFNIEVLSWFGFVPLFFAIGNKSKWKAFLLSYLAGIIFWAGIIYWLIHVTLPGTIVLVLYLALYFGVFGFIIAISYSLPAINRIIFIPSSWIILEYLRSHLFTGFGWALLGYSQYLNLPVIQIADITGAYGISFLVILGNVAIKEVLGGKKQKKELLNAVTCFLFLGVIIAYGYYKLNQTPNTKHETPIRISAIQGNIPQELKWNASSRDFIINEYFYLTRQAAKDKPDLIIWPEAASPVALGEEPGFFEKLKGLAKEVNTPLLLGTIAFDSTAMHTGGVYYNSALFVSREGKFLRKYDKLHLVPFGEYIPFRKIFGFLETITPIGDITAGKNYTVFEIPHKFSVLICFEDLFAELSREFRKKGARFIVNITNDAWFKQTSAPYQHLQASVFRAVENRVFLVRAANTGVSGFISPSGKIISLVHDKFGRNIFSRGYGTQDIVVSEEKFSFYTRYGDIFIIVNFIYFAAAICFAYFPKRKRYLTA